MSLESRGRLRWRGDYSEDGHYLIQTAHVRHAGTEYRLPYSRDGGPPFDSGLGIFNTRREVKAEAQRHAEANRGA